MSLAGPAALSAQGAALDQAGNAAMPATVKHVAGMLWYEMLSELNQTGFDSGALGAGGDDFQSMFLWNLAQNDFGKYDTQLLTATMRQIGGRATTAPARDEAAALSFTPPAAAAPTPEPAMFAAPASSSIQEPGQLLGQAKNFANAVWPEISAAAEKLNVPPVALLAQTALETGWGTAAAGNNLFGIKAVDGESGTLRPTQEMVDGVLTPQMASFRDYASISSSVSDYVSQIMSGFQAAAGQNTVSGFAHALQGLGYATDDNYAAKIISISKSPMMAQVLAALGGAAGATSPTN